MEGKAKASKRELKDTEVMHQPPMPGINRGAIIGKIKEHARMMTEDKEEKK